ncbi:hypothetical protein PAPYR_5743 [Paratrimastix pyriformis]|uniref:Pyridoxamine 5'-phosphate oxidase putative domain-containing protein n=1 Tax=Paratrimastix pyriformis TaxID=342808 RepID=A0ABQ8UIB0_9EUKA|nr:hypothetical protein PAPYR_5743 [Paratrimastix pyriformis]
MNPIIALIFFAVANAHLFNPFENPLELDDPHEMIDHLVAQHHIGILSTFDGEGGISSRPMWIRSMSEIKGDNATEEDAGILVMGTCDRTLKVTEVQDNQTVNLLVGHLGVLTRGWLEIKHHNPTPLCLSSCRQFVVVPPQGDVSIVRDRKLKRLAFDMATRVFFDSPEDPDYVLLVLDHPKELRIMEKRITIRPGVPERIRIHHR